MKVTTERLPDCQVKMAVEIEPTRVEESLRRIVSRVSRDYRIRGFRPGKAPFNVVVQRFGREALLDEVIDKEGRNWYLEALEEAQVRPFDQATLEITSYDPLVMTFTLPVQPVVDLGTYRDLRLDWQPPDVSDEQVAEELGRLQQKSATLEPQEQPAEMENVVTLDIEGRIGDQVVVSAEERAVTLSPTINYPVTGFAEKILGMSPGEDREFALLYPQDHPNAAWKGQQAYFRVHMHNLKVWVTPELDDDLAQTIGGYETLDEWRTSVREELEAEALEKAENDYADQVLDALAAQAHIEYPAAIIEQELDRMMEDLDASLKQRGLGLENFMIMTGKTQETYRESMREDARKRVERGLVLGELIRAERLEVSEADIEAAMDRFLEALGPEADSLPEGFSLDDLYETFENSLMSKIAVDTLKAIARGEYIPQAEPYAAKSEAEPTEEITETAVETDQEMAEAQTLQVSTEFKTEEQTQVV